MGIIQEFFRYLKERKKWWFLPLVLALAMVAFFIWLSTSGLISPFIYTLF